VGAATPALADNIRDRQWYLTTLRIAEAHRFSRGSGAIVAVVDTGVDGRHVDLAGNILPGTDLTSARGGDGWTDADGHGTAMASLIAGHGHGTGDGSLGVAPQAKILPVRDTLADGLDRGTVAEGIRWAVDHGAHVVNLSLNGADTPALRQAVNYALERDVVVVAGVGLPGGLGKILAPARIPGVVAVSGVDRNGNIAASASGPEVAIAAPAKDIVHATKGGGYSIGTGTSDATAIVSGVVALIRSKYPDLDAANVINRLIQTADDKGPPGRDERYGFGIVNPVRALTADVPRVDRNPLLDGVAPTTSPTAPSQSESAAGRPPEAPPPAAQPDSESPWIGIGAGLAGLVVVGATTLLLLRASRNRGRSHVT
jgi:type VII secretion-associated serine protease mycosin